MFASKIWFYIAIPDTYCENTKLKGSYDNWSTAKSITIKNLFGYHIFILELNNIFKNSQYKILNCNGEYITLSDRFITNDLYKNCNIKYIDNNNKNNYTITDFYSKLIVCNEIYTIYIKDKLLYTGKLENGRFTDYGKIYNNGQLLYQGKLLNGLKNGNGTILNKKNEKVYSGYFMNDSKHGFGIEYYTNGVIKYQGFFYNNKYDGNGTYNYDNGNKYYQGDWFRGKRLGMGIEYDENENIIYQGIFINDIKMVDDYMHNTNKLNVSKTI